MFLKFPSILAGNGSATSYVVLAVILLLVIGVLYFIFNLLSQNNGEES
ncbi:hypothetical protein [Neolewinella antarctica]|uniref:Photosystem II protein M n=1 Tax=Neolewinella antarctica TaxID=442734 RepID=A0ABX0X6X6_9BACT|nr:hypothetical protein [Neolewinella antarctica]NJC24972.1 hypothetical protein [Neolewinella antarctica]